jgi:hypothetical protein
MPKQPGLEISPYINATTTWAMAHVTIYDEKQTRGSISNNGL